MATYPHHDGPICSLCRGPDKDCRDACEGSTAGPVSLSMPAGVEAVE